MHGHHLPFGIRLVLLLGDGVVDLVVHFRVAIANLANRDQTPDEGDQESQANTNPEQQVENVKHNDTLVNFGVTVAVVVVVAVGVLAVVAVVGVVVTVFVICLGQSGQR